MNFIFLIAVVDYLFELEISLVNGILSFYVLVVHGKPTDSLPSGQEYFYFEFSLQKNCGIFEMDCCTITTTCNSIFLENNVYFAQLDQYTCHIYCSSTVVVAVVIVVVGVISTAGVVGLSLHQLFLLTFHLPLIFMLPLPLHFPFLLILLPLL